MKKILLISLGLTLFAAGCNSSSPQPSPQPAATNNPSPQPSSSTSKTTLHQPIQNALTRITKKPFGIYVAPGKSPVSPEKYKGYHTGVDFEALPSEQNKDVPIYAACDGKILLERYATGYGGVVVQSCKLGGQDVTIVYGHLRIASVKLADGNTVTAGKQIGVLGKGYSPETSGERKHLHFGIHKGAKVVLLGYVQNKTDLSGWLDPKLYLK